MEPALRLDTGLTIRGIEVGKGYEAKEEGEALGFVNEVVPEGRSVDAARRWAARIIECSPMAIRASKEAVRMGQSMTVEEALGRQMEFPAIKALFDSDDIVEGPRAFSEKRAPRWRGI